MGDDTLSGLNPGGNDGFAKWFTRYANGEDTALLEELTRTYCHHPERLTEISELIRTLSQKNDASVIPEKFLQLWNVFQAAMEDYDGK